MNKDDIRLVLDEKRQVVRKSGLLEFVNLDEHLGNVGGLEELKSWLTGRNGAFSEPAVPRKYAFSGNLLPATRLAFSRRVSVGMREPRESPAVRWRAVGLTTRARSTWSST